MKKMGYPVIEGDAFFSKKWGEAIHFEKGINEAYEFALSLGFPVIVKPNSNSQGTAVAKAHCRKTFYKAMSAAFKKDRVVLVEKFTEGKDYRIVVLDNKIISAYERIPLSVTGDGKSSIKKLLKIKQADFEKIGRDTRIKIEDPRIFAKLECDGMSIESIPSSGKRVFLLDNANLSSGGDSVDVTDNVHDDFAKIAIRLTKDMGLRLCGVDLLINGDISEVPKAWNVIEINSAPGLDHYAQIGSRQKKKVEDLYFEVLKAMEK
jgi:D-alanine-D-alanine ligase-like ATP-grasp enzyme